MAEKRSEVMERTADREIVLTRRFDAPPTMIWEAWTDPAQVGLWWGPKGFTTTIEVMAVRVGGVWRLVMHGPDGTDYPNQSTFTEVVPYERLVYRLAGSRRADRPYRLRRLRSLKRRREERGSRCAVFASPEARDRNVREYGSIEGGKQTLERLAEYLSLHLSTQTHGGVR
jgi:uncharacterized protein YndB with AHSA1/START domain